MRVFQGSGIGVCYLRQRSERGGLKRVSSSNLILAPQSVGILSASTNAFGRRLTIAFSRVSNAASTFATLLFLAGGRLSGFYEAGCCLSSHTFDLRQPAARASSSNATCSALRVKQKDQDGTVMRNDRFVFCPHKEDAPDEPVAEDQVPDHLRREIEQFFLSSVLGTGKILKFKGWQDTDEALKSIRKGMKAFAARR